MRIIKLLTAITLSLASTLAVSAQPRAYDFTPSTDKLYVATAGEVILTFLSKTASHSNDLFLRGTTDAILNNQSAAPGEQYSLGTFQAGAELSFTMFVRNSGMAYYTGLATLNPDNILHAAYDITSGQSLNIGFEDIFNGGDKDYDDLVFSLNNVTVGKNIVSAVPEPQAYGMMALGLMLISLTQRKKS